MNPVTMIQHNKIDVAVSHISDGEAPGSDSGTHTLLLLHGLGEHTPEVVPTGVHWSGPILGLDFTGHGRSTVPVGGGYTSEILVGDVDAFLEQFHEPVTILGRGLGAYVALLSAAARPEQIRGAVLADGPGLAGGGIHPGSPALVSPAITTPGSPDPYALLELSRDVRPPDYVQRFVGFVREESPLEVPLFVAARVRPAWIEAVISAPGVRTGTVAQGLKLYDTAADGF